MHSLPKSLHCAGFSTPFSTSPHCAAFGSVTRMPGTEKRALGIPIRIGVAQRQGRLRDEAHAAPLEVGAQL